MPNPKAVAVGSRATVEMFGRKYLYQFDGKDWVQVPEEVLTRDKWIALSHAQRISLINETCTRCGGMTPKECGCKK